MTTATRKNHPVLVSACNKTQEGYRFASTAPRPFHVILVILNYLSKGHSWIDCIHVDTPPSFIFPNEPFYLLSYVSWAKWFEMISHFLYTSIPLVLVIFNKLSVNYLCILYIHFVRISGFYFLALT